MAQLFLGENNKLLNDAISFYEDKFNIGKSL